MTIDEFLNECQEAFGGKEYTEGQRAAFHQKLQRFAERDLNRIYSDLLETTKYLPKIADVYESAQSLGLLESKERPPHTWKPADCSLCRGEGRLAIIWDLREMNNASVEVVTQILQYSKSFDYAMQSHEFRSLFRCRCLAGDVESLPVSWPKFDSSVNPTRVLQVGMPKDKPEEMRKEFESMLKEAGIQPIPRIAPRNIDERVMELRKQAKQITEKAK